MLLDSDDDGGRRWPVKWIAAAGAVLLLVVFIGVTQLAVPGIAERRIRSELSDAGVKADVKVSAFPAAKLLFSGVDSAAVDVSSARTTSENVAALITKTEDIDRLTVSAPRMDVSGLSLTDVDLRKRGSQLVASATTGRADLVALLPPGSRVGRIDSTSDGIELDGSISVLGARVSGLAQLQPADGALVFRTPALPVVGPQTLTVFTDQRVKIDRVSVRQAHGDLRFHAGGRLTP